MFPITTHYSYKRIIQERKVKKNREKNRKNLTFPDICSDCNKYTGKRKNFLLKTEDNVSNKSAFLDYGTGGTAAASLLQCPTTKQE